jgi:hypothetical protein
VLKRSLFLILCACSGQALAAGYGSVAALLMAEGLSVQPLGQGGAWTARAEGEGGQRANPAGLSAQEGLGLGGGQVLGLLDDRLSWLDLGMSLGRGWGVGVQAAYAGAQDTARDAFGRDLGTFTDQQWLAGVALGGELAPGWRLGLGLKGLQEDNGGSQALAVAGDAGLQGLLGGGCRFGAAVLNAGGQVSGPGLPTPLRVRAGASAPLFTPRWQAEADLESLPNEGQAHLLLGTELGFDFSSGVDAGATPPYHGSLRAGGQFGLLITEDPVYSLGAGLGSGGDWDLDYALQSLGALGLTHRFSLTLHFGTHAVLAGGPLSAPYGLSVERRFDGLVVRWRDDNARVSGYNLYSDYGVLVDRLNPQPVPGLEQKFVRVTPSRTYNFYVRAVGQDGKEGPPSDVLLWIEP